MKYLKRFNEELNSHGQIENSNEAKELLSKIYDIKDEISLGLFDEFLVDIEHFLNYVEKHNGSFAGNRFDDTEELKEVLENYIEPFNTIISDEPIIYISPFWISRRESDILQHHQIYSDTIYLKISDDISSQINNDEKYKQEILRDARNLGEEIEADEIGILKSKSGKYYIRIWWD